ncbi:hypothetical protein [Streptomyces sp. NBC_00470]|uniref:hypothetical protein n=1 Tax=Streptomyces sp. NBC_00470 TaxID=2975753 RepID=UPI0030E5CFDB
MKKHLKRAAVTAAIIGITLGLTAFSSAIEFAHGSFRTVYTDGHRPHTISEPPIGRCIPLYAPVDVYRVYNRTDAVALVFDNPSCTPTQDSMRLAPNESAESIQFRSVVFFKTA